MTLLDNNGQRRPWERKQKRAFSRIMTFLDYFMSRNYQILRLDLTSSPVSDQNKLMDNFKILLKRIKRLYGYDIAFFCIKTNEGFGVLHCILAIKSKVAVWIDQKVLSGWWEEINKAKIVSIKRMGGKKRDKFNVAKYLVSQYLSGQTFVRYSYSYKKIFKIGESWKNFINFFKKYSDILIWLGEGVGTGLNFKQVIEYWKMLVCGYEVIFDNFWLKIEDKLIII